MIDKINKFIDNLTPTRLIAWVIVLVLVGWIIYRIYKGVKSTLSDYSAVKDYDSDSSNLSYPSTWYNEAAETLFFAMNGAGTDEDAIIAIIDQLQTKDDWNKLVKVYGVRTLDAFWINTCTGNLPTCLMSELSGSDLDKIRSKLLSIGVTTGL